MDPHDNTALTSVTHATQVAPHCCRDGVPLPPPPLPPPPVAAAFTDQRIYETKEKRQAWTIRKERQDTAEQRQVIKKNRQMKRREGNSRQRMAK